MSTKTLIVGGCSFTQGESGWPHWLKEYNNVVNIAKGGASNTYIFNSIIDEIEKHNSKDISVFAFWTDPMRLNIFSKADFVLETDDRLLKKLDRNYSTKLLEVTNKITYLSLDRLKEYCTNISYAYEHIVNTSLRNMWTLEEYCKLKNITFHHGSAISSLGDVTMVETLKQSFPDSRDANEIIREALYNVMNLKTYYNKLNRSSKFMGFEFDAWYYIDENDYKISENDSHPSIEGHKQIAKIIENFIKTGEVPKLNFSNYEKPVYIYD